MRDDALAPVIAIMLLLAVIVTFYSIWNALVIPSMKQSSEVEHLQNVESAFEHFSSDIEKTVSMKQDHIVFSEPVQMGGGDVVVDPLQSSGSLYVMDEQDPIYNLTLTYDNGNQTTTVNGTLVTISYEPLNNYWQDQGYRWQHGYINVTKYQQARKTPLDYYNMEDIENEFEESGPLQAFADSFGTARSYESCSGLEFSAVTLIASRNHSFVSGNGFGTLKLNSFTKILHYSGVSSIEIGSDLEPFSKETARNLNLSLSKITEICNFIQFVPAQSSQYRQYYAINQSSVAVTLNTVTIDVSAY